MNYPYLLDNTTTQAGRIFLLTADSLGFIFPDVSNEIKQAAAILGKKGGLVSTPAKAAAARRNGKKGGRPRKKKAA